MTLGLYRRTSVNSWTTAASDDYGIVSRWLNSVEMHILLSSHSEVLEDQVPAHAVLRNGSGELQQDTVVPCRASL